MRLPRGFRVPVFLAAAVWLAAGVFLPVLSWGQTRADKDFKPEERKAAILAKLPPYLVWKEPRGTNVPARIVIGLLGSVPFEQILKDLVERENQKAPGRTLEVRTVRTAEEALDCQLLFVPRESVERWREWTVSLREAGVLAVGESEDFLKNGGALAYDDGLYVHLPNARQARVDIDLRLLQSARKVYRR